MTDERPLFGIQDRYGSVCSSQSATRVMLHGRRMASFWHSSWIDGQTPASLFPLLFQHSGRKNITVRDAVLNGKWISDIAHNLNAGLLSHDENDRIRTDITDIVFVFIFMSGFRFEYG
jgi:hypothetical protein